MDNEPDKFVLCLKEAMASGAPDKELMNRILSEFSSDEMVKLKKKAKIFDLMIDRLEQMQEIPIVTPSNSNRNSRLANAPGDKLSKLVQFIYTKKTFERVFVPTIADGREEYFEALAAGENWKAKWRHLQIYLSVLSAVVVWFGTSVVKRFSVFWKML